MSFKYLISGEAILRLHDAVRSLGLANDVIGSSTLDEETFNTISYHVCDAKETIEYFY